MKPTQKQLREIRDNLHHIVDFDREDYPEINCPPFVSKKEVYEFIDRYALDIDFALRFTEKALGEVSGLVKWRGQLAYWNKPKSDQSCIDDIYKAMITQLCKECEE